MTRTAHINKLKPYASHPLESNIRCDMNIYGSTDTKTMKNILHCVKLTNSLLFKTRFPKSGLTYSRQLVNWRQQTTQGQSDHIMFLAENSPQPTFLKYAPVFALANYAARWTVNLVDRLHTKWQQLGWLPSQSVPSPFMMTSSNGNIFRVTGHLCGEFTGPRWIPHTKASDAELWCFLCCLWINSWVNKGEAGDLRRRRAHYDVTVMIQLVT